MLKYLRLLLSALLSVLLIGYLLNNVTITKIAINDIQWIYLPLIALSLTLTYAVRAYFYKRSMRDIHIGLGALFIVTGIYNFASSIVPMGVGHLSYPYLMRKYLGVKLSSTASTLLLYNIIRLAILIAILFISAYFLNLLTYFHDLPATYYYFIGLVSVISVLAIVVWKRNNKNDILTSINNYVSGVFEIANKNISDDNLYPLLAASLSVVLLNVFTAYASYACFGYQLSILTICFIISTTNLSSLLPINSFGQVGTYEAIVMAILIHFGLNKNTAIQIGFAAHMLQLLMQALFAIPCYLLLKNEYFCGHTLQVCLRRKIND